MYAISHIHKLDIVHRDLKLDNIMITTDKRIKLVDFGLSKVKPKNKMLKEFGGTPIYMAPEIFDKSYDL